METRNHKRSAEHHGQPERAPGLNNPQGGPTFDIYQQVTAQIIEAMETSQGQGRRLWDAQPSLPLNLATHKPYSGINVLMLWSAGLSHGYTSPYWLTYKQASDMGGQVRKGEHSELCIFYKPWESQETNTETGETETKTGAVLKSFRVFNLDQIDGIKSPATEARPAFEVLADAEALLQRTPAPIREGGPSACYIPSRDEIHMPSRDTFISPESFYSVAYHEATHASGHKSRLDRNLSGRFGDEAYAMEELVAELGAAFLCAEVGILPQTRADHAHYLANWVRALKSDKKAIFTAAAAASKAAAFIKGHTEARTEAAA
jgi:antirestriction protein ArdC